MAGRSDPEVSKSPDTHRSEGVGVNHEESVTDDKGEDISMIGMEESPGLDESQLTPSSAKKSRKKSAYDPYKKPKKPAHKPKVFEKNEIVVEAFLRVKKNDTSSGKKGTRTFKLDEDVQRSADSFHQDGLRVSCRVCVVCSNSNRKNGSYKTSILSVDDNTEQDMVRYSSENCYLFKFEHLDDIRMATRKSYQCLMEQSDPTEEQAKCKAEFQSFWDNLEIQVQRARDFLAKKTDEKTAMEELTNETLYPTKKEIEIELAEERKEEERKVQERKKEEAERKQKEAERKKAEKKQKAKGGATGRRTARCGTCQGCNTEPCNECIHCLDMPKNGGKGTMKKTCIHRSCENINYKKGSMNNIETARAILEKFRRGTQTPNPKTKSQTSDKKSKKSSTAAKNSKKTSTADKKTTPTPKKKSQADQNNVSLKNSKAKAKNISLESSDDEGGSDSTSNKKKRTKKTPEKLPQLVSKGQKLKVGFNFKTKKNKPTRTEEEEEDEQSDNSDDSMFKLLDDYWSSPETKESEKIPSIEQIRKEFDEISRKADQIKADHKEMEEKAAEERRRKAEERENGVGLNARWPITPEEYLEWIRTDKALGFFCSIVSEERDEGDQFMSRHNHLVHYPNDLHGKPLDDLKAYCRLDFLNDEDGHFEDEIKKVMREKVMGPLGAPPSIADEFADKKETWEKTNYGLKYFMYCIYQEGFIKYLMDKFDVDYKRAEDELLKRRYTEAETAYLDEDSRTFKKRQAERKEREAKEAMEERQREYEAKMRYWESQELPDIDNDEPVRSISEIYPIKRKLPDAKNSSKNHKKKK